MEVTMDMIMKAGAYLLSNDTVLIGTKPILRSLGLLSVAGLSLPEDSRLHPLLQDAMDSIMGAICEYIDEEEKLLEE